jgi:hypothetical protein
MLREIVKIWLLKRSLIKHLDIADYLLWLRDSVTLDQGTMEEVIEEKDNLRLEAEAHKRAARRIRKILNKYSNVNQSI